MTAWTARIVIGATVLLTGLSRPATCGTLESSGEDTLRSPAEAALQNGDPERTISTLQQAVAGGPARADDYLLLGRAHLDSGRRKQARRAFQKAVHLGAEAAGYNGLGLVHLNTKGGGLRAMYYFRRALSKDPDFVDAQYNLAVAYLKMRPLDALKAFEKAVDIDARHPDAYYRIGRLLESKGKPDFAIMSYRKQVEVSPGHSRATYRLGKVLLGRGQVQEAVQIFKRLMTAGGKVEAQAHLEMAILSQMARNFEAAQHLYEAYIARLPEAERSIFQEISPVASKEEMEVYDRTPEDRKAEMVRRFWNRLDPTPLTPVNERLIEHYRRVAYARQNFPGGKQPWDDRGDVYVRLGSPDHISRSDDIRIECDPTVCNARENFANRLHSVHPVAFGRPTFPVTGNQRWEYWVYTGIGGGAEITFVNPFSDGLYTFAPVPDGIPPSRAVDLLTFHGDLFIRNIAARNPSAHGTGFADLPVEFHLYPAGFRGPDGVTRLEVTYGLPASEAARLQADEKTGRILLDRGMVLYDSLWSEVHRVRDRTAFHPPTEADVLKGAFIPGTLPVDLPPGPYRLAFQVRDVRSGKSRVYRHDILLDDYRENRLQISDIEPAFSISPSESDGPFVKQGMRVIPMPSRTFRRNQHAFVYFEAYNLARDPFGQTRYRVEYTVRSYNDRAVPARLFHGLGRALRLGSADGEIAIAYDQVGDRPNETIYLELDLTGADFGQRRLQITVTDLLTQQESSKEIVFNILP